MGVLLLKMLTKRSAMNNQKILNNYIGSSNMSDWNLTDWLIDWLFKILECAWLRRFFGFFSWTTYLRAYLLFCFLIIVVCCDEVIHVALFKLSYKINKNKILIYATGMATRRSLYWVPWRSTTSLFFNFILDTLKWLDTNTHLHGILYMTIEFDNCSIE